MTIIQILVSQCGDRLYPSNVDPRAERLDILCAATVSDNSW